MLWLLVVGLLAIWLLVVFEDNNLFKKFVITKNSPLKKIMLIRQTCISTRN